MLIVSDPEMLATQLLLGNMSATSCDWWLRLLGMPTDRLEQRRGDASNERAIHPPVLLEQCLQAISQLNRSGDPVVKEPIWMSMARTIPRLGAKVVLEYCSDTV
jgi:hypothetical protein